MALVATGNRDEALDIIQDAMIKLVKNYAGHPEEEWPPLFYRIVQSTIRDWYRRQQVRSRVMSFMGLDKNEEGFTLEDFPDPGVPQADEAMNNTQAARLLDRALHRLPLRQQQVFMLRAWEGQSTAETAQAMRCTEGTVKTHYSRAVHTLREILGDYRP